jgi:hypothetical protein
MTKIPEEKIPENDLKRKIMKIRVKMPDPSPAASGSNRYPKTREPGMVCWIESARLYQLRGLMLGDDPRYAKGMPNRMV